ncbi:MAG TPA: MerR family transcriptional regulator [Nitrospiria bacterium]|nr:MerR family transcriptional regulator [Nitrospiria bacterium]
MKKKIGLETEEGNPSGARPDPDPRSAPPPGSNGHERLFYKISEVSDITGLEAYILRYWESEFPILRPQKSRGRQRIYQKKDIETILKIKQMLYEKGFTIAGARKVLAARNGDPSETAARPISKEFVYRLRGELAEILRILSSHDNQSA